MSEDKKFIVINGELHERTSINLDQMHKVKDSGEYEDLFLELDKIKDTLKTGSDIADAIEKRVDLPRSECLRLMTAYLLRK